MEYVDFLSLKRSRNIGLFFPDWKKGEKVAFLSPHDDDVILGAGYLLMARTGRREKKLPFFPLTMTT